MAELNKNKSLLKKAKREVKDSKQKNQKNEANIKLERDALNRERQQFEAYVVPFPPTMDPRGN